MRNCTDETFAIYVHLVMFIYCIFLYCVVCQHVSFDIVAVLHLARSTLTYSSCNAVMCNYSGFKSKEQGAV